MIYEVLINDQLFTVQLEREGQAGEWVARLGLASSKQQREFRFSAAASGEQVLSLLIDGRSFAATRDAGGLVIDGKHYAVELRDPRSLRSRRAASAGHEGPRSVKAPMPGKVVRVLAAAGAEVEAGEGILVVEAMKMQNELKSPKKGRLQKVTVSEGAAVNAGDVLAVVE